MLTFLKAQLASVIASAVDFLMYYFLKTAIGIHPVLATVDGSVTGGIVNYSINRWWVFHPVENKPRVQVLRYVLVWAGNILLNATGMYLFTRYTTVHHVVARLVTGLTVGIFYNYFLQKKFVFK